MIILPIWTLYSAKFHMGKVHNSQVRVLMCLFLNNMVKFKCNFCYISFQCKYVSRQGLKFEFCATPFYLYNYVLLIQILHLTLIVEVKSIGVFCNAIIANYTMCL